MKTGCLCVIPARYASTRLRAKVLAKIGGKPLIQHVWERALRAKAFSRIVVATDDHRIRRAVLAFGGEAMMTSPRLNSGTERAAETARRIPLPLVVNLQGDEPFISSRALASLVAAMRRDRSCLFATLARRVGWNEIAHNPNAVKIVPDSRGRAAYFSRSPVPFAWDRRKADLLHHIGVYIFRRRFLLRFARMGRSELEKRERLEQLRVLEYGIRPKVVVSSTPALSVDTPGDLKRARKWYKRFARNCGG